MYIIQGKDAIDTLLTYISKTFNLINERVVGSYIGMHVRKDPNVTITMNQPAIIEKSLNGIWICDESKMHDTPENVVLATMKMETEGNKNGTIVQ